MAARTPGEGRRGLSIRAADGADAPGLAFLLCAAGVPATPGDLGRRLRAMGGQPGGVLLAEDYGPPVGVLACSWTLTLTADPPAALITALIVDPERRRRGIARLLLKAAAQAARQAGCGRLDLHASETKGALKAFCEATGFENEGVLFTRSLRKGRSADGGRGMFTSRVTTRIRTVALSGNIL